MVEHSGLDIMCVNKYCHSSSSSSSSSEHDKKIFSKLKRSLSRDYPRKNAEFLSGQYGTNVLLIGAALMLAMAHHGPAVKEEHLLSFVTCLMLLQLLWMMWYILARERQSSARTEKDVHATTCWIRGAFRTREWASRGQGASAGQLVPLIETEKHVVVLICYDKTNSCKTHFKQFILFHQQPF